ncbi:MAG: hypothetical protein ACI97N_000723 [Cognaticolwellia sp.]|jgi:hypothetical protein
MKYQLFTILLLFTNVFSTIAQVNFTDSNLPIFIISTDGGIVDEPKVGADLGIIDNNGQRNSLTDAFNDYDGRIGIELRGQTSQFLFDKKSYGFETRDANGENLNVSLLDLPEENDWILYGPFSDKTMIRNVLMYELSNQIGMYASRTKYCELVINNEYKGVYVLMEKIKRDGNRVDIAKLNPDEISETDISGGYILKLDKYSWDDQNLFNSAFASDPNSMLYQVIYPKNDNLQSEQFTYIQDFMYDFEAALSGENYKDETLGYRQYIDVNSFIDFLLLNELGRNPDAYRISTYFHKQHDDDGGKLKMGPIWDFNIGMGNANFCLGGSPTGWVLDYNEVCPDDTWLIGYWWNRLLSDEAFALAVSERWEMLRETVFSIESIHQLINDHAILLNESQTRNYQQWNILGEWVWPNDFVGETYESEVVFLKNWFDDRVDWMDANMSDLGGHTEPIYPGNSFLLYPNPFDDVLNIAVKQAKSGEAVLTIFNTVGQKITSVNIDVEIGLNHRLEIPKSITAQLNKGLYFYVFKIEEELIHSGKLVRQ